MTAHRLRDHSGLLLLLAGSAVDSTSGLLSRLVATDAFTISAGRGIFAFMFLLAILLRQRGRRGLVAFLRPSWPGLAFALINACGMIFNMLSLTYAPVANFFMIFAAAPFAAAIAGWLVLDEKFDRATLLAASAGFVGVAIMMYAGARSGGLLGDFFALCCVFSYASLILVVRRYPQFDLLPTLCLTLLVSALVGLPFSHLETLGGRQWLGMVIFGVVQLGIGNLLIFNAVSRIPAAQGGLLGILNAAFAPLWVLAVLGVAPPAATLVGGGVVLGAAILHLAWTVTRPAPAAA
jgi:drug/metabolite transporter (DMT)-like permease